VNAILLSLLALGCLLLLAWALRKRSPRDTLPTSLVKAEPAASLASTPPPRPQAPTPVPASLAAFRWIGVGGGSGERRLRYIKAFRDVPRPPKLLQQLLSPAFLHSVSTAQLVDLINAEPLFAARLLAAVNSPTYGLARKVLSVEQAVMILGLETVRSVCLQYMMISSFKADTPQRQVLLDTTWTTSALASEITQRLARSLPFEDRSSAVSSVVLSFLGRLATVALTPMGTLDRIPARDLLARTHAEQALLGLGAAEIGRLLMIDWDLPAEVISDACEIDQLLVGPCVSVDPRRVHRLAVAYIGARLGERVAEQGVSALTTFDLQGDDGAETFFVKHHFTHPSLASVPDLLRDPALHDTVSRMLGSVQELSPA